MHFIGYRNRVAVRLAIDVQQHGRLSVGPDNGVKRLDRLLHRGNVTNAHRKPRGRVLDDGIRQIVSVARLPAHQAQHELMIALKQPGRIHQVRGFHRIQDVRNRHGSLPAAGPGWA